MAEQPSLRSMSPVDTTPQSLNSASTRAAKSILEPQRIFRYLTVIILGILIFCVKGFYEFRQYCITKGYYVFSADSLVWCVVGFLGIFILKYSYYSLMYDFIEKRVKPKYTGDERVSKTASVLKLSLDFLFYTGTTILAYVLFSQEYWFPSAVGGCGSCGQIYREYPNWPSGSKRGQLGMYFMIQLGVHMFSVFQMVVIKGKQQRKYHEYLLHHVMAASLILFSMMSNQLAAGSMILIVHDASDIMMAFSRFSLQLSILNSRILHVVAYILTVSSWVYMRIIVFPFCLLSNVFVNKPTLSDEWHMINFEYNYLLAVAFVLYAMHIFWTYFLFHIGFSYLRNKQFENTHEKTIKD